jgi:hypothetical protein
MTAITGGHEQGLLDGSATPLKCPGGHPNSSTCGHLKLLHLRTAPHCFAFELAAGV